jgi:hypothetical protein
VKEARLIVFSLAAATGYTLAYYFDWPLFVYEIAEGRLRFFTHAPADPSILWYGWIATAVLAGLAAAFVLPARFVARFLPDLLWLLPTVLVIAAFLYEKRWFM